MEKEEEKEGEGREEGQRRCHVHHTHIVCLACRSFMSKYLLSQIKGTGNVVQFTFVHLNKYIERSKD